MKSLIVLIFGLAGILLAGACAPKDSFTIKGEITGLTDGTVLELVPARTHKGEKPLAEISVTGQVFTFTGKTDMPRLYGIRVKGVNGTLFVLVENGVQATVKGKAIREDNEDQQYIDFSDIIVTGSPLHDTYTQKISFRKKWDQMYQQMQMKHDRIGRQLSEARANHHKALVDSLTATEAYSAMTKDENKFLEITCEQIHQIVLENKDSWWGPFLMLDQFSWFEEKDRELFAAFPPEVQQSYYGLIVYKELYPETLEGKSAPAFTVIDSEGKKLILPDLLKGKKLALIDFCASWCGPCRKEIPNLKNIYGHFAPKGLEIISISLDKDPKAWQKALGEEQLPWPNFRDTMGISDAYDVKTIPAIFLLDGDGKVLAIKLRGEALKEKLGELLP